MKTEFGTPMVLEGYAIYNPATEKWSRGGVDPNWGKTPKIWSKISHLKSHINQFVYRKYDFKSGKNEHAIVIRNSYKGCIIVDVTTGREYNGFKIYDQLKEYATKESKQCNGRQIIEE